MFDITNFFLRWCYFNGAVRLWSDCERMLLKHIFLKFTRNPAAPCKLLFVKIVRVLTNSSEQQNSLFSTESVDTSNKDNVKTYTISSESVERSNKFDFFVRLLGHDSINYFRLVLVNHFTYNYTNYLNHGF
jgi:hypothetical protein